MTTRNFLWHNTEHLREVDGNEPFLIVICSNAETLRDGSWHSDDDDVFLNDVLAAGVCAIAKHSRSKDVSFRFDDQFAQWNGGWHSQAGKTIGRTLYGYRDGLVCTHDLDPPEWFCELIEEVSDAIRTESWNAEGINHTG